MKYDIEQNWLEMQYVSNLLPIESIADEIGCSIANIKRLLKKWKIKRGDALRQNGLTTIWNKGLTKDSDARLMQISEDRKGINNPMSGKPAWNAGLTKEVDDRVAAISVSLTGKQHTEKTKAKMSDAKLGLRGAETNRWKGGVTYANGYEVHRSIVNGMRKYDHRIIAEEMLDRPLLTCEHVHHIDRDKGNNFPNNLIVLYANDHNLLHRAIDSGLISRDQQIDWLKRNEINYLEICIENSLCKTA